MRNLITIIVFACSLNVVHAERLDSTKHNMFQGTFYMYSTRSVYKGNSEYNRSMSISGLVTAGLYYERELCYFASIRTGIDGWRKAGFGQTDSLHKTINSSNTIDIPLMLVVLPNFHGRFSLSMGLGPNLSIIENKRVVLENGTVLQDKNAWTSIWGYTGEFCLIYRTGSKGLDFLRLGMRYIIDNPYKQDSYIVSGNFFGYSHLF